MSRKMARPSSRPMPSGQRRTARPRATTVSTVRRTIVDADHLAAGRLVARGDDLQQPVLGGQVVEQAEHTPTGDAAGQPPLAELAGDPERRDGQAERDAGSSCAGRAAPSAPTAFAGGSARRGRRRMAASSVDRSSRLTPAARRGPGAQKPTARRADAEADADQRERPARCLPRRRRGGRGPCTRRRRRRAGRRAR